MYLYDVNVLLNVCVFSILLKIDFIEHTKTLVNMKVVSSIFVRLSIKLGSSCFVSIGIQSFMKKSENEVHKREKNYYSTWSQT